MELAMICECGCAAPVRPGRRFVPGHNRRGQIKPLRYIAQDRGYSSPCWTWQLAILESGYGLVWDNGRQLQAHKHFFERRHGAVPSGWYLDHLCRNRDCVNPDHLEVVTHAENVRRGAAAKLSYEAVDQIRALIAEGAMFQKDIATLFGVSPAAISEIKTGDTWSAPGGALRG